MRLTMRRLNRATLARQLLLRRERLPAAEGVRRVVALQAQEAASPYLALWNRLEGFDPADLDAAFATHEVVKSTLMRITLHAVHAGDYPAFHNAMVASLRAARLGDRRFTGAGLSVADADALLPHLLELGGGGGGDDRRGGAVRRTVLRGVRSVGAERAGPGGRR
ncbi:DNA glycosylase AlkZ-like family protein, partial [Nonomuraea sp. NPDC059022]|uniref:DNA glycosylase AlkZ-like family protein n=1 Tax=Nonomuraea sp. NPDC059022 TaxID=3346705 RepID=UPI003689BA98